MEPDLVYASNNVKRYHTVYTIQTQTVGAHTANMLGLLLSTGFEAHPRLYQAIIIHDWPEVFTGDLPANFKKMDESFAKAMELVDTMWYKNNDVVAPILTEAEEWMLRWLDAVEAAGFCQSEIRLGNQIIMQIYHRYQKYIAELLNDDGYLKLKEGVREKVDTISDRLTT